MPAASRWTREDLLYLLYTSGTTAKPKGIAHTTAGYLVGVATTHHYVFDVKPDSVYWCAADVGWVTGPQLHRLRAALQRRRRACCTRERPDFPDKDRWWEIVERYRRRHPLHGADRDPHAHEVGPGARAAARPLVAAAARLGRRADQPRGVGLVPRAHRRRPLPDRRHVVADRDGDDHDHAASGDHDARSPARRRARSRASRPRSTTRPARRSARAAAATSC